MASQFLRLFAMLSSLSSASPSQASPGAGRAGDRARRVCSLGSLSIILASSLVQAQTLPSESDASDGEWSLEGNVPVPTPEMLVADQVLAESQAVPAAQTARSLVVAASQDASLQSDALRPDDDFEQTTDEAELAGLGLGGEDLGEVLIGEGEVPEGDGLLDDARADVGTNAAIVSNDDGVENAASREDADDTLAEADDVLVVNREVVPEAVAVEVVAAASVPAHRYRSVTATPPAVQPVVSEGTPFQSAEAGLIEQMAAEGAEAADVKSLDAEAIAGTESAEPLPTMPVETTSLPSGPSISAAPKPLLSRPPTQTPVPSRPVSTALSEPKLRLSQAAKPFKPAGLVLPEPPAPRSVAPRLVAGKDIQASLGEIASSRGSATTARGDQLPALAPAAYPGHRMAPGLVTASPQAQQVSQALPTPPPGYGQPAGYPMGYPQPMPVQGYPQPVSPSAYGQQYAPQAYPQPHYGALPVGQPVPFQPYYVMYAPTGMPMYMVPAPSYSAPGYSAPGYPAPGYPVAGYPAPNAYPAAGYAAPTYPAAGYAPPGYPVAGYPAPGVMVAPGSVPPQVSPQAYPVAPAYPAPGYAVAPQPQLPFAGQPVVPQQGAPVYGGTFAAASPRPLLLPPPPAPGSYGNNFGLAGGAVPSGYAAVPSPPGISQPAPWNAAPRLAPATTPTALPQWPASASIQPVPNSHLPIQVSPSQPPLSPEPVLTTPTEVLPQVGPLPGAAIGGPLDGPTPGQTSPGVVLPPPVPQTRQEANLPQFQEEGRMLRTSALGRPNYSLQGVFLAEGSDTAARARITSTYPLTPNLLFGGSLDVSSGDSFSVGETNGFSVNELYAAASLEQLPNMRFVVGQLDLTSYFDRNSFAKDSATHFFNSAFQTNPALSAAGIASRTGLLMNWTATDNVELKAAAFSSDEDLGGFALDGFAGEIGVRYGNAIIRGTYVSDKDSGNDDGFQEVFSIARSGGGTGLRSGDREQAYGVNAEWYVPNLKMGLFGRYGRYENLDLDEGGDTFGLGFNFQDVFSQDDRIGLAYGRNLSNESLRRDFNIDPAPDVLELFYDFRFLPNLRLGFSLQGRDEFSEAVAGFRLKAEFDATPRGNLTER